MKFRTEYKPLPSSLRLSPANPIVLIGSCFAQNIGVMMRRRLWNAVNATGVLYNPVSVGKVLDLMLLTNNPEKEFLDYLFQKEGCVRSWLFDSRFASENEESAVEEFMKRRNAVFSAMEKGKSLIVTFGTSICYVLEKKNVIVGNCHKQPGSCFSRKRLSIEDIAKDWNQRIIYLQEKFPGLNIIFTVSPVRHLKDGFEGNSRSKAVLLLAVEEICRNNSDVSYFPAYEILNDDLRDYRFYASDLVHPSEEAVEYISDIFKETYLDEGGKELLKQGEKIVKGLLHKLRPEISGISKEKQLESHRSRIEGLKKDYYELVNRFPYLLRFDYPFEEDPGF